MADDVFLSEGRLVTDEGALTVAALGSPTLPTDVATLQAALTALTARVTVLEAGTVSVASYGATGAGIADDTAAIQAAIAAAPTGGRVWFPPGTYQVSAPIRLRGGLTYEGPGHGTASSAVIRQVTGANIAGANGVSGILVAGAWATNAETCDTPIRVQGLEIDGNAANNPSSDAAGIVVCSFWSTLEDCYVRDAPSHGILLTDVTDDGTAIGNSASENRIYRCRVLDPGGDGIHQRCQNTIAHQDGYCVDNVISGGDTGIRFERGSGWVFRRNHTYGGTGHGIYLERCYATIITENEIEAFGAEGGAGTYWAGISVSQLNGRGSHVIGNFVGSAEGDASAGGYQYISVSAASGQADAHTVVVGNIIHGPAVTSGHGIGLVLQADFGGSVLNADIAANRVASVDTARYVSTGVVLHEPVEA